MKKVLLLRWAIVLVPAALAAGLASATAVSELTLGEVLEAALQQTAVLSDDELAQSYRSSGWLASLPSVSANFLESDQHRGTDEREISLNFPLKSSRQRGADRALQQLASEYEQVALQRRKLYLSGAIREAIWSHRLARVRLASIEEKYRILEQLEARYQQLFAASAVSEYSLLLLRKELVLAAIERGRSEQDVHRWARQFDTITGLGGLPEHIAESPVAVERFTLDQHPELRLLQLDWLQTQHLLLASSNQSQPWDVSLTAKTIRSGGFEEDQYGLGVEIPLSFLDIATQSHNSEWQRAARQYDIARDELRLNLQGRWENLCGEGELLQRQAKLLVESAQLSTRIAERAAELRDSNELAEEVILRQMIDSIDAQAAVKLNQTRIQQNNAMLRQAAGITL